MIRTLANAPHSYDFKDILVMPAVVSDVPSRKGVNVEATLKNNNGSWNGVPIIASNMTGIGTFEMARSLQEHKVLTAIQKHYTLEDYEKAINYNGVDQAYLMPTVGADEKSINNLFEILEKFSFPWVCFDVANGHTDENLTIAKSIMDRLPKDTLFMYGNVANPHIYNRMIWRKFNPDAIKIGIGSGSVCTTRIKTGIGVPQASAIENFYNEIHNGFHDDDWHPYIVSDGGCREPGDIVKAFVLGSDMVMLGGMLAGHDEGLVTAEDPSGSGAFILSGSSSEKANGFDPSKTYRTVEGKSVKVRRKGPVSKTILDILGGIRSACTYLGINEITEMDRVKGNVQIVNRTVDNYTDDP